jgi:hypothetical protein
MRDRFCQHAFRFCQYDHLRVCRRSLIASSRDTLPSAAKQATHFLSLVRIYLCLTGLLNESNRRYVRGSLGIRCLRLNSHGYPGFMPLRAILHPF